MKKVRVFVPVTLMIYDDEKYELELSEDSVSSEINIIEDDAIEAYWLCSESDRYGEVYNIGGDETCTVGEALDMLISKSDKPFKKVLDKERLRPTDITLQIPCTIKFQNHFNWESEKSLNDICDDLLEYWRNNI